MERNAVSRIAATGYGRKRMYFADMTLTGITCHAIGVRRFIRDSKTVIEIGLRQ